MKGTRLTFHQVLIKNHGVLDIEHAEGGSVANFETDLVGTSGIEPEWAIRYVVTEPLSDEEDTDGRKE